jgi:quercetin dioxygenase-like cupin family protein
MRSTSYALTLALILGCGGGQSTDSTTPVMTEPPPEEPVAETEQPTEPEKPAEPPAPPEPGDPAQVGPDIYKVVTENDQLRAFEVTFAPGAKIAMHKHPDHLAYALTDGKLTLTMKDGAPQEIELKAGQAMFLEAQAHAAENKTDKEIKALVVELRGPSKSPAPKGKDPLKAGPKIYKKVFENEKVRVFETTFKKGAKIPDHAHPDHWVYVVTGGQLEITGPNAEGKKEKQALDLTPGQGVFLPATVHSAKNTGKSEVKLVVVELKPAAGAAPATPEPEKKPAPVPEPKPTK